MEIKQRSPGATANKFLNQC